MLPYEKLITEYVEDSGNHVLYRVTPIFEADNSLAVGVLMEGMSVEDNGDDVCFCIFAYNVQPGIGIDYATGDSWIIKSKTTETTFEGTDEGPNISEKPAVDATTGSDVKYIMNTNTKKLHVPSCSSVDDMKPSNKQNFCGTRDEAIAQGYKPCGRCNP